MSDAQATLPPGRPVRIGLDSDALIKRGLMLVIAAYLVAALALPLYAMLSKSFTTYSFDLTRYEFQVSDESGANWSDPVTARALNDELNSVPPEELDTISDGRLPATSFFPDFSFRSPVKYRIRGTVENAPYLVGLELFNSREWQEVDSNTFRRVMLRPVQSRSLANYKTYFSTPSLFRSIENSFFIASVSTVITIILAFGFANALNRSCMPFKPAFRLIAMMPILVPSLLPGIALVYMFGNQGYMKELLLGESIYGPLGIVIGSVFFTFPHAMIIISTALSISDQRHYEAAESLRSSKWRTFWTVTIPGARYGLISAAFVVFTLVITDFGLPKVIGGQYNVLAVDIYKQVIGQ
ncbi:MAG: ABC transporter permease subunit, partial [Rhodobiaceae bacterium]|nr:ABC transporter permease subunit [Rhodobiaceae bacterium]